MTVLFLLLFFSGVIYFIETILLLVFGILAVIFTAVIGFYLLVILLSFPFVLYLVFVGVFSHPKDLITIRAGRATIISSLAVIFLELSGQTALLSGYFGLQSLPVEAIRGFAWVSILLLTVAYLMYLYVEGYQIVASHKEKLNYTSNIYALIVPARVTISL
ncbi:MAG: hypothetical protein AAF762_02830, partial [Pseudomonadota bacterium]